MKKIMLLMSVMFLLTILLSSVSFAYEKTEFNSIDSWYISTTALLDGNVLIAYVDDNGKSQFVIYDEDRNLILSPTIFGNNGDWFESLSATTLNNGNILITYNDYDNTGFAYLTIFNSSGNEVVSPVLISSATIGYESSSILLNNGNVLIAYRNGTGQGNVGVFVIYDENGNEVVGETIFNNADTFYFPTTLLNNGNVLIAYQDANSFGSFVIYDEDGNLIVSEVNFNNATSFVSAITLNNGNIMIIYEDSSNSYYGTLVIYDETGNLVLGETIFNTAGTQYIVSVVLDDNNIFIVYSDGGNSDFGTFVIYDEDGNEVVGETIFTSYDSSDNSVSLFGNGDVLLAFRENSASWIGAFVVLDFPYYCGDIITSDLTMTQDLLNCDSSDGLIINASDITLDCGGFVIASGVHTKTGIELRELSSGVNIKNCEIVNFLYGISSSSYAQSCNTNITPINIQNTYFNNNTIGLELGGSCNPHNIRKVTLTDLKFDILEFGMDVTIIDGCSMNNLNFSCDLNKGGLCDTTGYLTINNCDINNYITKSPFNVGIMLYGGTRNNTLTNLFLNVTDGWGVPYGIWIENSDDTTIINSEIVADDEINLVAIYNDNAFETIILDTFYPYGKEEIYAGNVLRKWTSNIDTSIKNVDLELTSVLNVMTLSNTGESKLVSLELLGYIANSSGIYNSTPYNILATKDLENYSDTLILGSGLNMDLSFNEFCGVFTCSDYSGCAYGYEHGCTEATSEGCDNAEYLLRGGNYSEYDEDCDYITGAVILENDPVYRAVSSLIGGAIVIAIFIILLIGVYHDMRGKGGKK